MKQIGVAVVGTGWCGGIRAETCAAHALVKSLHLAEIAARAAGRSGQGDAARGPPPPTIANCCKIDDIDAVYVSATPETHALPDGARCLAAGKHVFLEKPIALELARGRRAHRAGAQE